jgi:hypothetical protein
VNRERNLDELLAFLEAHSNLVVILAHCGAGPGRTTDADPPRDLVWYGETVLPSLLEHGNLYFDIAGMFPRRAPDLMREEKGEDGVITVEITNLGRIILEWMRVVPERFLAGFDIEDDIVAGDDSWDVAVDNCTRFLAELDEADTTRISRTNAEGLLWPAPS